MGRAPEKEITPGRGRVSASVALVLVLSAPGVLAWAWSRPSAAPPLEMPALLLDPRLVQAELARDEEATAAAPADEERRRMYHEVNVAEHEGHDPPARASARRQALRASLAALIAEQGEEAVDRVRARDLSLLEPALRGELAEGDRIAELGGFVSMMERYGMVRGGRRVAPAFVVRTAFAARWNAMHERELTDGFSEIERRAYWGWLATHGESAPVERRLLALDEYAEAGGTRAAEMRAVVAYDEGRLDDACAAFQEAYEASPTFRLRNHALLCAEPDEP